MARMSTNFQRNKERKSEKPIRPSGGEQGAEWRRRRRRTEEELYRVVLLWDFHRGCRQQESVTGTERKTEEKEVGKERRRGENHIKRQTDRQTQGQGKRETSRQDKREGVWQKQEKIHPYERRTEKEGQQDGRICSETPATNILTVNTLRYLRKVSGGLFELLHRYIHSFPSNLYM